jgi:uncharacterized membrane protein (DUF2068 family)
MNAVAEHSMPMTVEAAAPSRRRAPTLYAIIAIKLTKGLMLLLLALGVYSLAGADLAGIYKAVLEWINVDPERQFCVALAKKISTVTPTNVYWVAIGAALYSAFSLVEGFGLLLRVAWAGWLVAAESAFFIPIEVYDLLGGFSTVVFVILVINVGIVWYLLRNRQRLFPA